MLNWRMGYVRKNNVYHVVRRDEEVQTTILGIDFIMHAAIVIDSGQRLFWFNDDPKIKHLLKFET